MQLLLSQNQLYIRRQRISRRVKSSMERILNLHLKEVVTHYMLSYLVPSKVQSAAVEQVKPIQN